MNSLELGRAMQAFHVRWLRVFGLVVLLMLAGTVLWLSYSPAVNAECRHWQDWRAFKNNFISDGGRVVEAETPRQQTVSEAQAYALFFALVANDRASFDKLLKWTQDNLAEGDLTAHLPAWLWGKKDDNSWGVVDANSAADADLWLAYTLGEAGRLWSEPRFTAMSALLANRILRSEVVAVANFGSLLLPGPTGFQVEDSAWRLNPSYVPLFILQRLALDYPDAVWPELLQTSARIIIESAPQGFAPNWLQLRAADGFAADSDTPGKGSYDAIRVYLWAGMMSPQDPLRGKLLARLHGMADYLGEHGVPPEIVDTLTGTASGDGPSGFSAALLPFLAARGDTALLQEQLQRLQARPATDRPNAYYDQVLALFGKGWYERYFSFAADGSLNTSWDELCAVSP